MRRIIVPNFSSRGSVEKPAPVNVRPREIPEVKIVKVTDAEKKPRTALPHNISKTSYSAVVMSETMSIPVAPTPTPALRTFSVSNTNPNVVTGFSPSTQTFANLTNSYFALAGQGGGGDVANWAQFPAVTTVDMNSNSIVNTDSIQTNGLTASAITTNSLVLNNDINGIPYVPTQEWYTQPALPVAPATGAVVEFVDTSGTHNLATIQGNLYYDGQLLAKAGDIQNISDWALYPAISDVNVNDKNLTNVNDITMTNVGLTQGGNITGVYSISPESGGDLTINMPGAPNGTFALQSDGNTVMSLTPTQPYVTFSAPPRTVAVPTEPDDLTNKTYVDTQVSGITPELWANYPAVANIDGSGNDIVSVATANLQRVQGAGSGGDLIVDSTNILTNSGNRVDITADGNIAGSGDVNITSGGGLSPEINLTANPSTLGIPAGVIRMTANGGTVDEVAYGGLIELNANSGGLTPFSATSAIKMAAAGINSYAGAIPSVGSLAGYNFTYGTLGINMCVGLPSVIPNVPGSLYMYAPNGIVADEDFYTTNIYPRSNGLTADNLVIQGRSLPGANVEIQDCERVTMVGASSSTKTLVVDPAANRLASQNSPSNNILAYLSEIPTVVQDGTEFYVSNNGSDSTGTGTIINPYRTIQYAITQAEAVSASNNKCIINVASGVYAENLTFTKGYVTLTTQATDPNLASTVQIVGNISVAVTGSNDLFGRIVAFIGFTIIGTITDTSTVQHTLSFNSCYLANSGATRLLYQNSTGGDARTYISNCTIQTSSTAISCVEVATGWLDWSFTDTTVLSSVPCILISGTGTLIRAAVSSFEATHTGSAPLIRITSPSPVPQSIGNCTFAYTNATGKVVGTSAGIFLPNNATTVCLVYNNVFSLLGLSLATGFAVDAATGISTPPVVVNGANYNNGVNAIKVSANCISVEATQMANNITLSTANIGTLTTTTPLTSMTQSVVVVPANTANMDTGAQLLGTTASGNYSIGGQHVTTNGVISSTKISVPNVYTYVSAGNWYWRAEVSGSTSNTAETWTVNIVKYAPTVSTATGINAP